MYTYTAQGAVLHIRKLYFTPTNNCTRCHSTLNTMSHYTSRLASPRPPPASCGASL